MNTEYTSGSTEKYTVKINNGTGYERRVIGTARRLVHGADALILGY